MMMALGIPGDIVTAVMLGALMIHNIIPGPTFIQDEPLLAYGVFIAFFVAHFFICENLRLTINFYTVAL